MAEEQLTLVDGMSASLRRIYLEAERLNKRMLTLKTSIKSLEKPASLSYLRRELKETEKQAQMTEKAIIAMRRAEGLNNKYRAFTIGANGTYYVNGVPVPNAGRAQMAQSYINNVANGALRRNKMLWDNGRTINGMSFDQRWAALHPFRSLSSQISNAMGLSSLNNRTRSLSDSFYSLAGKVFVLSSMLGMVGNIVKGTFIEPQSHFISNLSRVALTSDRQKTPFQMMDSLYETATRTRAPADATFMLYNRIALSGVKASNERIRRFVESFNKVTAMSGTTGQENRAVMLQLAQGIGSNRLGGDEFRSISEQAPLFKYMLAKGLGVNPGALKEMGAQGKLTAEAILSGLEKVQNEIDDIYKHAPLTIEQSLIQLQNTWSQIINKQFVGYIAIRDLIRDIVRWMASPRGQDVITKIVRGWNIFIYDTVQLIRKLAPWILWLIEHIKQIWVWLRRLIILFISLKVIMGLIKLLMAGLSFYTWFQSGVAGAVLFRTALAGVATGIKGIGVAIHAWIPELLAALALIVAITKLMPLIKDSIAENKWVDEQLHQKYSDKDFAEVAKEQNRMLNSQGAYVKPSKLYTDIQKERERLTDQYRKDHPKEGTPEYYEKLNKDATDEVMKIQGMLGMADSSKNVPMVSKVGEVGKVNDAISIDNDGIEMMKAIAERQWVMQNEVSVPQNVSIAVTKEADVDEERLAEAITGGMRLAVASSMRGAPVS